MKKSKISQRHQRIIDIFALPILGTGLIFLVGTIWDLKVEIERLNNAEVVLITSRGCQAVTKYVQLKVISSELIHQFDDGGCGIKGFEFWFGDSHLYSLNHENIDGRILLKKEDVISFSQK